MRTRTHKFIVGLLAAIALLIVTTFTVLALASGLPSADANVNTAESSLNENDEHLRISGSGASCNLTAYTFLKWDLSDITNSADLDSATLTLTVNAIVGDPSTTFLNLYETTDGWVEGTVTHDTAPAAGTLIQAIASPMTVGGTAIFSGANLVNYLKNQVNGDKTASFQVRMSGNCVEATVLIRFNSKESSSLAKPDMQILDPTTITLSSLSAASPVGTPWARYALFASVIGLAAAALVWMRRR